LLPGIVFAAPFSKILCCISYCHWKNYTEFSPMFAIMLVVTLRSGIAILQSSNLKEREMLSCGMHRGMLEEFASS
jgi:hypothetical protein